MSDINYDYLLDYEKVEHVYHIVSVNTKHREKLVKFNMFKNANIMNVLTILEQKNYHHDSYNIFIISEPKYRIIMSERINDKIINHLISHYVLWPFLDKKLIDMNVATRKNKGNKKALEYLKKYINKLKINYDKFYVLKCDISKFFYSIDHQTLISKLSNIINDSDILDLLERIITSTDNNYVNLKIDEVVEKEKRKVKGMKITSQEKINRYKELDNIPRYETGKGLPIGNMTSQILAIFYLNDLDHYIKETLGIKYYIRYMDDFILFHPNREYLKYCLNQIKKKLEDDKLILNSKTQIYDATKGFTFLGYRVKLVGKRLHLLMSSKAKKRIVKRINSNMKKGGSAKDVLFRYNGYLISVDSKNFIYRNSLKDR